MLASSEPWTALERPPGYDWHTFAQSVYRLVREYLDERGEPTSAEDRHERAIRATRIGWLDRVYERTDEELASAIELATGKSVSVRTIERWRSDFHAAFIRAGCELPAPRSIPKEGR